ncbi:MAG: DUF3750 domain-containing protein [Solirubrobacteraceae bacterium]|nr:DUF3750 domain-containing protein [Solirubrobacteraceae bacterium]
MSSGQSTPSGGDTDAALAAVRPRRRAWWSRALFVLVGSVLLLLTGPLAVLAFGDVDLERHWYEGSQDRVGLAPDAATVHEPMVQVYGARTVRWRGAFGIHPWIAVKRSGASEWTTYQMVGWRSWSGGDGVVESSTDAPDRRWYGAEPMLLAQRRGPGVDALIDRIEEAVRSYPWSRSYRIWPGPNSNTFAAWIARRVPELGLDLPATAIGKDYLGPTTLLAPAPSGTGWQLSVFGLLGATVARAEGLELNLLGLNVGIDVDDRRLRLPGVGFWPGPVDTTSAAPPPGTTPAPP